MKQSSGRSEREQPSAGTAARRNFIGGGLALGAALAAPAVLAQTLRTDGGPTTLDGLPHARAPDREKRRARAGGSRVVAQR
jgi:hypothetical protein